MDKVTVLVTSAGSASAINVIKSLRLQNEFTITVVAVDIDKLAAGLYLADHYYICPPITKSEEYLNFLYQLCKKHNINALYPCYSKELSLISKASDKFNELGTFILLSPPHIIDLCDDKVRMSNHVRDLGIPVPKIIYNPNKLDLPLFSKLSEGSGSKGAIYVKDVNMLEHLMNSEDKRIYQEFIEGDEYTVDILCDKNSNVLFSGPRKRIAIKSGQSVKGITVYNKLLQYYTERICKSIGVIGVCNIQFIEKDGDFYFIEINPRYAAGGLMLTIHAGANLPLMALKLMMELPLDKSEFKHAPNFVMTRYWNEIIFKYES